MAQQNFQLASSEVLSRPDPATAMIVGVPAILAVYPVTGSNSDKLLNSCRVFVKYEVFSPNTEFVGSTGAPDPAVTPYRFGVIAVLEQQQTDLSWEEIGRQNMQASTISDGKEREIYVSPVAISQDEGVDIEILGFDNVVQRRKSAWQDESSGELRVRIVAWQGLPNGETQETLSNPFVSVQVSVSGTRFDA